MITVRKAQQLILEHKLPIKERQLEIDHLCDSVLQSDLFADRDYPPFHRVAMDGIAICYETWKRGNRSFAIESCQKAGQAASSLQDLQKCIEVMTGAVLPKSCDVVIRYEDLQIKDSWAHLDPSVHVKKMQNIHQKASDYQKGELLLSRGTLLSSPQWSIVASIGAHKIRASKVPSLALVTTGDELVEVCSQPLPHQIRRSNVYGIVSSLKAFGFHDVKLFHLQDDMIQIMEALDEIVQAHEVIVLSGGVSKGKYDFIPKALSDLKVRKIFHGVKQKPGKPLWFGVSENAHLVFGLPGNPVSALICFHRYILPVLWRSLGLQTESIQGVLDEQVVFKKNLSLFLPVKVSVQRGTLVSKPIFGNGSGDFACLRNTSGFLELPGEKEVFEKAQSYPLYLWRSILWPKLENQNS